MAEDWYRIRSGLSEHILMDAFEKVSGLKLDREQVIAHMRNAYLENIGALSEISMIASIARKNVGRLAMAVASGGPAAIVVPSLRHLKLDTLFDAIITLDDVGVPKPAPNLFIEAARRCNIWFEAQALQGPQRARTLVRLNGHRRSHLHLRPGGQPMDRRVMRALSSCRGLSACRAEGLA